MLSGAPIAPGVEALGQAKAYLRVAGSDEDDMLIRLLGSAAELCERFIGQALLLRRFGEIVPASGAWTRLGARPVATIVGVEALAADGVGTAIPAADYAIDIDAAGDGWVRLLRPGDKGRVRVSYDAGLASEWSGLPEALRQGALRLVAHLFAHRDAAADVGPPAAVTALWRPYRRMRIG